MKFVPLPQSFYKPSAKVVAPLLLGHWLIRNTPNGPSGGPIVETEAYLSNDPACHASRGKTPRNAAMFGPPGLSYVYLIYGYHFCFNTVCCQEGIAEAVLIRAIEPAFGEEFMRAQRPVAKLFNLTNGPAKICSALKIERDMNDINLCSPESPVFVAKNPDAGLLRKELGPIVETTRIGITKAADLPLRFYLNGSPFVSRRAGSVKKI